MRARSWYVLLPLAMLAAVAGCGGEYPKGHEGPGDAGQFDWDAIVADGDWAASHAGFYWSDRVPALSEVRLVDRRALGESCGDIFDPTQVPSEFTYMRLRLPNLEAATYPIVASGEDVIFNGAQLRLVRVWNGTTVPELEAVAGTVTIAPGASPEHVTVAVDASFATSEEIGPDLEDGVVTFVCQDGESREVFECDAPGCCYGERRIPFTVTLDSAYCPAFCNSSSREARALYCPPGS